MREAVIFSFLLAGFAIGLSAIIYGAILFFWEWQRRRSMRRKIRALGL